MTEPSAQAPGAGELRLRVLSALVMAAGILALSWWGGWPFRLVWTLVAGFAAYEWLAITGRGQAVAGGALTALVGLLLGFLLPGQLSLAAVAALLGLLAAVATPFVASPRLLSACGIAYALVFALVTPVLRDLPGLGLSVIAWSFAVVWLTDSAAYFAGRRFGGPKLMPRISPKKTWSGALGGTFAGTLGGLLVWALSPAASQALPALAVLAVSLLASVASQAGDLFESGLKRRFGAKDSSRLIPGHGGFLDRLDGYWAVLTLAGGVLLLLHFAA